MNYLTTTKVVGYLAIIFVAGAATGAVITLNKTRAREAETPSSMEKACNRLQGRLISKVGLSPEQVATFQPVFDEAGRELRAIHSKALRDTDQVICKVHREITPQLSEEQKAKLDALDTQRREWLRRRLKGRDSEKRP